MMDSMDKIQKLLEKINENVVWKDKVEELLEIYPNKKVTINDFVIEVFGLDSKTVKINKFNTIIDLDKEQRDLYIDILTRMGSPDKAKSNLCLCGEISDSNTEDNPYHFLGSSWYYRKTIAKFSVMTFVCALIHAKLHPRRFRVFANENIYGSGLAVFACAVVFLFCVCILNNPDLEPYSLALSVLMGVFCVACILGSGYFYGRYYLTSVPKGKDSCDEESLENSDKKQWARVSSYLSVIRYDLAVLEYLGIKQASVINIINTITERQKDRSLDTDFPLVSDRTVRQIYADSNKLTVRKQYPEIREIMKIEFLAQKNKGQ